MSLFPGVLKATNITVGSLMLCLTTPPIFFSLFTHLSIISRLSYHRSIWHPLIFVRLFLTHRWASHSSPTGDFPAHTPLSLSTHNFSRFEGLIPTAVLRLNLTVCMRGRRIWGFDLISCPRLFMNFQLKSDSGSFEIHFCWVFEDPEEVKLSSISQWIL